MPRNSSGTYTLPSGNPVVTNTLIESVWANTTMPDIGAAMTDSLDRYGRGGMLAPLKLADGTQAAPAFSFNSEASTGLWHAGAGTLNVSVLGTLVAALTTSGLDITGDLTTDTLTTGTLSATAFTTAALTVNGPTIHNGAVASNGTTTLTQAAGAALVVRSGAAGSTALVTIGRTANEGLFGISGGPSNIIPGDVAGDLCLVNTTGAIRFGLTPLATGYLTINTTGITAGANVCVVGAIPPGALLNGTSLGTVGGFPGVALYNAGAGVDNKRWDQYANATTLVHRVVNDAFNNSNSWMEVNRSGVNITSVNFPNGQGVGVGTAAPNYGAGITTVAVGGSAQSVFDLQISGIRTGTFTVAAGASTAVTMGSLGARPVELVTNTAVRMHISGGGLVGIGRTPVAGQLEVAGGVYAFGSEAFRAVSDAGYLSWFNSANSWRLGYLQFQVGGTALLVNEVAGGYFQFNLVGAPGALTVNTAGAYVGPGEPFRLTRVNEFSITSTAASVPNIRYRHGRVAVVVAAGGTVTFATPFTSVYACVVSLEGGAGGGWILRTTGLSVNGFSYAWDNWSATGSGAAAFLNYRAVGV